jgi:8-oxo-dGTP pyrophosphatase MutT (NUDIX family)
MAAAEPVPAATIMLLREGKASPEVLMLERHAQSEFLPDLYVFPGGRVDPGDYELFDRVSGLSASQAVQRAPSVDPDAALAFFVAAIRETFEEAGVLLARRRGEPELVSGELAAEICAHRLGVQDGTLPLREIVESYDLELAAERLSVHGHWITPVVVPRRFDTLFFAAAAPRGHEAVHDGVESSDHVWIRPDEAIAQAKRKQRQMIFPTLANLQTLTGFASVEEAMQSSNRRKVIAILPRLVGEGGDRRLVIPSDAGYPMTEEKLELPAR